MIRKILLVCAVGFPAMASAQTVDGGTADVRGTSLGLEFHPEFYRGRVVEKDALVSVNAAKTSYGNGDQATSLNALIRKNIYWGSNTDTEVESGYFPMTLGLNVDADIGAGPKRHTIEANALSFGNVRGSVARGTRKYKEKDRYGTEREYSYSTSLPLADASGILEGRFVTPLIRARKDEAFGLNETQLGLSVAKVSMRGIVTGLGTEPSPEERKNGNLNQIELAASGEPAVVMFGGVPESRLSAEASLRLNGVAVFRNTLGVVIPWTEFDQPSKRVGEVKYEFRADQIANSPVGAFVQYKTEWTGADQHRTSTRIGVSAAL